MVQKLHVDGPSAFRETVSKYPGKTVYVLFSGSVDSSGQSWCPDCVAADPVVEEGLKSASEDSVFIHCSVGDRAVWKDPNNYFRTDPQLKLTSVPTLMKWGSPQRLGDKECSKSDLVQMLFEED